MKKVLILLVFLGFLSCGEKHTLPDTYRAVSTQEFSTALYTIKIGDYNSLDTSKIKNYPKNCCDKCQDIKWDSFNDINSDRKRRIYQLVVEANEGDNQHRLTELLEYLGKEENGILFSGCYEKSKGPGNKEFDFYRNLNFLVRKGNRRFKAYMLTYNRGYVE